MNEKQYRTFVKRLKHRYLDEYAEDYTLEECIIYMLVTEVVHPLGVLQHTKFNVFGPRTGIFDIALKALTFDIKETL